MPEIGSRGGVALVAVGPPRELRGADVAREREAAPDVLPEPGLRPQHVLVRGVALDRNSVAAGRGQGYLLLLRGRPEGDHLPRGHGLPTQCGLPRGAPQQSQGGRLFPQAPGAPRRLPPFPSSDPTRPVFLFFEI